MFLEDFQSLDQYSFLHTYPCQILMILLICTVWTVKQGYRKKLHQPFLRDSLITVFPHKRPAVIFHFTQPLNVDFIKKNTTFLLHKSIRNVEIIRIAGIIRGRVLYEEIWYLLVTAIFSPTSVSRVRDSRQFF